MSDTPGKLLAGAIGKPHGILGEVYVVPISDDPRRFAAGSSLVHEDGRTLVVRSARRHRDRLLVHFQGIGDRRAAEGLRGALYVGSADVRELGADEYWTHELVGCDVVDRHGAALGRVTEVIAGPAQDLLTVQTPRGDRLVPLVKDIVIEVELGAGRVVIEPPPGLME